MTRPAVQPGADSGTRGAGGQVRPVFAEQVGLLYASAPESYLVTLLNACILAYLQRPVIESSILLAWLLGMLVIVLIRALIAYQHRRAADDHAATQRWNILYAVGAGLAGIWWGAAGLVLFAPDSLAHQILLLLILGGMAAGAVVVLSPRLESFAAFCFPAVLPVIGRLLAEQDDTHVAMAGLTFLYVVVLLLGAWRTHRTILASLTLRFENADLVSAVTATRDRTERTNATLRGEIAERKRIEADLRESEEKFRLLAETINEVFWIADRHLARVLYVSPAYETIWGRSRRSLYENARSFIEAVHPDDRPRVTATLELKHQREGTTFEHEYRIVRPDGSTRWIWDRGFPVPDPEGQVTRMLGLAQDITERKLAEMERSRLLQEWREAMDNLKVLRGLLPICASCKKVRDDQGYWKQIESYIMEHSEAQFSHGVCPDCLKRLYPDMYEDLRERLPHLFSLRSQERKG